MFTRYHPKESSQDASEFFSEINKIQSDYCFPEIYRPENVT